MAHLPPYDVVADGGAVWLCHVKMLTCRHGTCHDMIHVDAGTHGDTHYGADARFDYESRDGRW